MTLSIAFRPALRNWIRAAAVLLLCASTVALYGFDDKRKEQAEKPKPAAKPAPKPTPQVKSSGGGNASPSYNKTPVTNPNLYKQPATTTTKERSTFRRAAWIAVKRWKSVNIDDHPVSRRKLP